jgi:hypothetical protein
MKNIPSYAWNKDFFFWASIFFDSKKRPGDSPAKKENKTPQILATSASMEAVDNNRFFTVSQ